MGVELRWETPESLEKRRTTLGKGHVRTVIAHERTPGLPEAEVDGDGNAVTRVDPLPSKPAEPREVIDWMLGQLTTWMAHDPHAVDKAVLSIRSLPAFANTPVEEIKGVVVGFFQDEIRRIIETDVYRKQGLDRGMLLDLPTAEADA